MNVPHMDFALAGSLEELKAKGRLVVHGAHRPILVVYDRGHGRCHVAMRKARAVYVLRIFKPPRRPRATWSSPRRVARGVIWLT